MKSLPLHALSLIAVLTLSACGGGSGSSGSGSSSTQARFDYPSALDTSFAVAGYATASTGLTEKQFIGAFAVNDFMVDRQGRFVVVGARTSATREAWLVRFLQDGSLDPSCGDKGWLAFSTGGPATPRVVKEMPDGRYAVGGYLGPAGVYAVKSSDCSVDTSFGVNGLAAVPSVPVLEVTDAVVGMDVDASGRILATVASTLSGRLVVARFTAAGKVDPSFGTNGVASVLAKDGAAVRPENLVVRPDGRVLVSASMQYSTQVGYWAGFVQLLANGQPDAGFGDGGFVSVKPRPNFVAYPKDLVVLPDGSAIQGGFTQPGVLAGANIDVDAYWLKVNPAGQVDTAFGGGTGLLIAGMSPADRKESFNSVKAMVLDGTDAILSCQDWTNGTKVAESPEFASLQAVVQKRSVTTGALVTGFTSGGTGMLPRPADAPVHCNAIAVAKGQGQGGAVYALLDYGAPQGALETTFAVVRVRN
jgi:uncharacterized delta-60 repeat protein